jgi:hypothetical protein
MIFMPDQPIKKRGALQRLPFFFRRGFVICPDPTDLRSLSREAAVVRRYTRMWKEFLSAAASLLCALAALSSAKAQAPLNWAQNVPGNSKPIVLYADDVTSWSEKGSRIFLLKGKVWIEHGVVQIQVPQCTIWVDEAKRRLSGIYHVDVYADGEVSLQDGPNAYAGLKGHIELNTRGEIHLKAYRGKVVQAPAPADGVFLRAVAMKYNLAEEAAKTRAAVSPTIQPVVASQRTAMPPAPVAGPSTTYIPLSGPMLPTPPPQPRPAAGGQDQTLPALPARTNTAPSPGQAQLGLPQ